MAVGTLTAQHGSGLLEGGRRATDREVDATLTEFRQQMIGGVVAIGQQQVARAGMLQMRHRQIHLIGIGPLQTCVQGHAVAQIIEHRGQGIGVLSLHLAVFAIAVGDGAKGLAHGIRVGQQHLRAVHSQQSKPPVTRVIIIAVERLYHGLLIDLDKGRVLELVTCLAERACRDQLIAQPVQRFVEEVLQRLHAFSQHQGHHHGEREHPLTGEGPR
ncbi:hypothetical protein [Candidatus Thiosymbion oneisti]|uniref:hypothetical protein n=1 Tax=Candidatus Thiosymbion oneisti TaxID=589554 RepID=UPI0010601A6B|nr:hypothetical protein [Candidatus Thiosymbion oneisti]